MRDDVAGPAWSALNDGLGPNETLVERLRQERRPTAWTRGLDVDYQTAWEPNLLCHEAAAEIVRLRCLVEAVRGAFNRECDDLDAILRALGLDPANCRTDGGSLMLQDVLETIKHSNAMVRYEAMLHKDRSDDCGRLARMVLDCCPTAKCTNLARDCYGSGCLSDEPQNAVAAAFGGIVQTPQG